MVLPEAASPTWTMSSSLSSLPSPSPSEEAKEAARADLRTETHTHTQPRRQPPGAGVAAQPHGAGHQGEALAKVLAKLTTRLEAMEAKMDGGVRSSAGVQEAVASVVSYRGGRAGSAAARRRLVTTPKPTTSSLKEKLRASSSGSTPFPPEGHGRRRSVDSDQGSDDEESASAAAVKEAQADGRIAGDIMHRVLANHRSALDYVRSVDFGNLRASHEARRTAQAIDALMREGVPLSYEGMEILVRNMAGVVEADKHNDSAVLEGLEWALPQDIVPRAVLRTVMKDAKRRKQLKPAPRDNKNNKNKNKGQQGAGKI